MKQKLLVITGPTAVGKSGIGIELCRRLGGEIISADSMQIYKGMDIGTAKVSARERAAVAHHIIDIISPKDSFSAADFAKRAKTIVEELNAQSKQPVIVGGTGLYINSLIFSYDYFATDKDETKKIRAEIGAYLKENGGDKLYEYLRQIDMRAADTIHPNNTKRVMRAIEIFKLSGKKKSDTNLAPQGAYDCVLIGLTMDRELLYGKINSRVDAMMKNGFYEEVEGLFNQGCDERFQSMQAIGYKQLLEVIRGKAKLSDAIDKIKQYSRNYAKRQMTWFKKMAGIKWIEANDEKEVIISKIMGYLE
jgi:tRNA dimethylallyltransferase